MDLKIHRCIGSWLHSNMEWEGLYMHVRVAFDIFLPFLQLPQSCYTGISTLVCIPVLTHSTVFHLFFDLIYCWNLFVDLRNDQETFSMATSNSTTPPISGSNSSPASTLNTTSTVFSTSTTSSPTTRSTTDAGRPSDVWATSTITFVTVSHSTPTTSTLTTVVPISGPSLSSSPSFRRPLSAVDSFTQLTETATEWVPKPENTSSTVPDTSKSQRRPSVPVLVVIGLVVASFIGGILFLLFYRRRRHQRRHRHRPKEVEHIFQRPGSCSSFLDTDPFVCVAHNLAPSVRSVEDENSRGITQPGLDASMTSNSDNEAFVFRKPRSLENDSSATKLSSQHDSQRTSPCSPTSVFEQDEMINKGGQSLEQYATEQTMGGSPSLIPISRRPTPLRPPRSPRLNSKRSARHSFDSVSTAHSSSASPLHRPSPRGSSPWNHSAESKEVHTAVLFRTETDSSFQ